MQGGHLVQGAYIYPEATYAAYKLRTNIIARYDVMYYILYNV